MSSSPSSSSSSSLPSTKLPVKLIPGDCGHPFFGPFRDRLAYFYHEGRDRFFENRIRKHQSTIFRTNMPPGPLIASCPRVICLLDAISFPVLFDTSKVEKQNVLAGTFLPSLDFTGGHRVCAYLDPSEPNHSCLKSFILYTLAARHLKFIPLFQASLSELFDELEATISTKKQAYFNTLSDTMSFNYVFRLLCDKNPNETKIGSKGPKLFEKWLIFQLAPLGSLGFLPNLLCYLEDILLRSFTLPFFVVKSDYKKLYDAFYEYGGSVLDEAENKFGIQRDEACHNLVFLAGFNAYGAMKVLFPALIKWVASAGQKLHKQLADEIRTVIKAEGGGVTLSSLNKMALTKSVVYEYLRIDPPVPFQYGKAKADLVVQSHDAAYEIKKGEMIFGYQPFASKDPKVFENPEEFVADRFVGEKGEKLLKYVYWSNGRETEESTAENKVCAGKDMVLLCRVMLVELFLRYDTFEVEAGTFMFAPTVTFKLLTKASSSNT